MRTAPPAPESLVFLDGSACPASADVVEWKGSRGRAVISAICPKCHGSGRFYYSTGEVGVCFRCEGTRQADVTLDVYTPAGREAALSAAARKAERATAKAAAKAAELSASIEAQRAALSAEVLSHAAEVARGTSGFALKIAGWLGGRWTLSEGQIAALIRGEEQARAEAARRAATPALEIAPGTRLDLEVTFEGMAAFDSAYGTRYIYRLRTADEGALLVYKTASDAFFCDFPSGDQRWAVKGDRFRVRATVRGSSAYRGEAQTEIERARVTPLTTVSIYPEPAPSAPADPAEDVFAGFGEA